MARCQHRKLLLFWEFPIYFLNLGLETSQNYNIDLKTFIMKPYFFISGWNWNRSSPSTDVHGPRLPPQEWHDGLHVRAEPRCEWPDHHVATEIRPRLSIPATATTTTTTTATAPSLRLFFKTTAMNCARNLFGLTFGLGSRNRAPKKGDSAVTILPTKNRWGCARKNIWWQRWVNPQTKM